MRKVGSPLGNAHAVLYAHTGTYGSSSVPTGSALATSDNLDVSTIGTGLSLIVFTFSGAEQYEMQADAKYCIVFENPASGTIDGNNRVDFGFDNTGEHGGNYFRWRSGAWDVWGGGAGDGCFYIYGDAVAIVEVEVEPILIALSRAGEARSRLGFRRTLGLG